VKKLVEAAVGFHHHSFPTKEDAAKWTGSLYPTLDGEEIDVFGPSAVLRFLSLSNVQEYLVKMNTPTGCLATLQVKGTDSFKVFGPRKEKTTLCNSNLLIAQ